MARTEQLQAAIEARIGCEAPPSFIERTGALTESVVISHPHLPDRSWRFLGLDDLLTDTQIDRHRGAQWESAALFGMMLGGVGVTRLNGAGHHSTEFLSATVSFAHDNGDFLFIRPDSSVWLLHHDGHEIQRISDSFSDFAEAATWPRAPELAGAELNEWESKLAGRWCPVSSDTADDPEFFNLTKHDLVLSVDRTAKLVFSDEESDETWHADGKHFVFTLQGHELPHTYRLDGRTLDITTTKFGDHTRYERANG